MITRLIELRCEYFTYGSTNFNSIYGTTNLTNNQTIVSNLSAGVCISFSVAIGLPSEAIPLTFCVIYSVDDNKIAQFCLLFR